MSVFYQCYLLSKLPKWDPGNTDAFTDRYTRKYKIHVTLGLHEFENRFLLTVKDTIYVNYLLGMGNSLK